MNMRELVEIMPCMHCDNHIPLDEDRHVWDNNSHAFCPRKLKLRPIDGFIIGNNQQVYSSQWRAGAYTVCDKCGKLVHLHSCWRDEKTGGQVHRGCLTIPR